MDEKMNIDLAVLYFTKKASQDQVSEFEQWLNSSHRNLETYKDWAETWEATAHTYKHLDPETDKAWQIVKTQTIGRKQNKSRKLFGFVSKAAAGIILFIGVGLILLWLTNSDLLNREKLVIYSSGADTLAVNLSDGSRVCMNKYSILVAPVSFNKKIRKVTLDGEAYFDVKRDSLHPFKIFTKSTITEVLGTSFNLRDFGLEKTSQLTLVKGKVAFCNRFDNQNKVILYPGQQAIYSSLSGYFKTISIKNLNMLAWKTGELQFKNASLAELSIVLSSYYKVSISYQKSKSNEEPELFNGNFINVPLDKALDIIKRTLNVNISKKDNKILIYYN